MMSELGFPPCDSRAGAIGMRSMQATTWRREFTRSWRQRLAGTRSRRVGMLLAGVVVLSAADLIVTLTHLQTIGMFEANPLASWLIRSTHSPAALVAFKATTVGICAAVLFALRRRLAAEIAAWAAVAVLAGMCVQWYCYSQLLTDGQEMRLAGTGAYGETWLLLD